MFAQLSQTTIYCILLLPEAVDELPNFPNPTQMTYSICKKKLDQTAQF